MERDRESRYEESQSARAESVRRHDRRPAGSGNGAEAAGLTGRLLSLQQSAGNRAVTRLVQAKLLVGPVDDPYERQADRIASLVTGGRSPEPEHAAGPLEHEPTSVQRAAAGGAGGGFEAPSEVGTLVGGGKPLPAAIRGSFEPRLGADLSRVAVHDDAGSAAVAEKIGARAFTSGSHMYFGAGQYNPHSQAGRHLIAHEVTHVLQQTGGVQRKPIVSFDGALVPTRLSERRIQGNFFKNLNEKRKQFFGRSDKAVREKTGDENLDKMSKEEQSTYMRRTKGGGPGENPDWSNPKFFGKKPNKFKAKLAVAQEDANWLKNVTALRNAGYKAIFSGEGRKALGNMDKNYLAKRALENQGALDGKSDSEIAGLVKQFTNGIYDVGHTWIRLETYVGDELKDLYSFGMWPAKIAALDSDDNYGGFAGPVSLGQGEIRHPDNVHEGDAMTAYFAHDASKTQFAKALDLAMTRYQSPPPYVLVGYNCTTFAREIFQSAGGAYPSNGTLLPGFAYTPGNLYHSIMKKVAEDDKKKDQGKKPSGRATSSDEHKDIVEKAKTKQEMLSNAGKRDVQSEIFGVPKPDAKTSTVHMFAGNTIRYGIRPDFPEDSKLALDKDRDMVSVANDAALDRFGVYTFWMGPKVYWYVPEDDVDDARHDPNAKKPPAKQSGLLLPMYNGTSGGFHAPAPDDKPNTQVDRMTFLMGGYLISNTEGEWVNIQGVHSGEFYWVKKTWYDYFFEPDKYPLPPDLAGGATTSVQSPQQPPPQRQTFSVTKDGMPYYESRTEADPSGVLTTTKVNDFMLTFDPFDKDYVVIYLPDEGKNILVKVTDYHAWCKLVGREP